MANVNSGADRWWVVRALLRFLMEGLIQVGSTWIVVPPLPPTPRLPAGHPERLVPHAAPTGAERMLWRQFEDDMR